jgi:haloalkane dehalogenase
MRALRTPDERFDGLADWPYAPHYEEVGDTEGGTLRLHYADEGPPDAPPVLLLHGEPTWGYLYRSMIPPLADAGLRVVVPDLAGFGRSDKPADVADYTFARQVQWTAELVDGLGLRDVTLVGQDWGGLVGLRLVAGEPDRYARVVACNHGFPTGDRDPTPAFLEWLEYSQAVDPFPAGEIVGRACLADLPPQVIAAYDAPYPDETFKAGARVFPALVPIRPDDPAAADQRAAWEVLEGWTKPFLTAFGDSDPVTAGADAMFQQRIPGARGQAHVTIAKAGHNLPEDAGAELAAVVAAFAGR